MAKKKNQKKNLKKQLLPVIIVTLTLSTILLFASVVYLFRENQRQEELIGSENISYFIEGAIDGLTNEAPTASYSNQQFIDSAKVKFNKTESVNLYYFYSPEFSEEIDSEYINNGPYIQLSSEQLVKSSLTRLRATLKVEDTIKQVPRAQNCSRLFIVNFEDNTPEFYSEYKKVYTKPLEDGRTAFVWKSTGDLCQQADDSLGKELFEVVKTIQSY
jgi:hypothetical protein